MADNSNAGFWGAVLSGIGKAVKSKNDKKGSKQQLEYENVRKVQETGNEERKTLLYQTLLTDWQKQKDKYARKQGLGNYNAFAKTQGPGSSPTLNAMLQYNSPNQLQDPGAVPDSAPYAGTSLVEQLQQQQRRGG